MEKKIIPSTKPTLEDVQNQFAMWRETRKSRKPIPKELWEAAAALCDDYTINQISKALHLNHTVLKKRIESIKGGCLSQTVSQPTFIELDLHKSKFPAECIVEMEKMSGTKMRICFKGEAGLDLVELTQTFWDKQA